MRVIVTGGAGFIGSNFIRLLLSSSNKYKVIAVDKITYAANRSTLDDFGYYTNFAFIEEDICNQEAMLSIVDEGDIVVNFAAESHVDNSISNPNVFLETNILGVQSMLTASRTKNASLFIQISTDEVYGSLELSQRSSIETDMLLPSSPYSASKAAAEMLCFSAMRTFEQPIIITRSSNNFGPYQFPEKVIPLFITRLNQDEKVPVYGNGMNIRDWIFVEDNCKAIRFVMEHGKRGEIYNIGGGNELSNIDLTKIIINKMGKSESSIEFVKDRLGHDKRYSLDCSKLIGLGWKPSISFEQGMDATVRWYLDNKQWWEPLIRRNK